MVGSVSLREEAQTEFYFDYVEDGRSLTGGRRGEKRDKSLVTKRMLDERDT